MRHRLVLAFLCIVVLQPAWARAQADPTDSSGAAGKRVAALLDLDRSAVGPLLQNLLSENADLQWIERDALDAILKENALRDAFSAASGNDRMALGKLLK